MRVLNQNRQILYYSNFDSDKEIYAKDEDGNIIYTEVDGKEYPVVESNVSAYSTPTKFKANISFNSGDTQLAEYGLNVNDYNAIIVANKGELPFDERTLIWHKSEPKFDKSGNVLPESADYRVKAIKTSLNEERFVLKKRVDDE